jgi:3-methyladenine DNA glycosylase/8-oxoguanine DNA glycosylase
MGSRLTIRTPADYALARDVCSYGYFRLAPDHWDPENQTLSTTLDLDDGPTRLVLGQTQGGLLHAEFDRMLARTEQQTARLRIARMLRLDETQADIAAFHAVDPRWKQSGRGRIFRSPTLFQDIVRTITSCNITWPGTVSMNRRLCQVLGRKGAFPSPKRLARTRPGTLRGRCRVGYRDGRLIELARMYTRGQIDELWLEDPQVPDEQVYKYLLTLPGVGPYGASNILQLLGRYSRLAVDTETVRHGKSVLGLTGEDPQVIKSLQKHYDQFGAHKFRSYWFELWTDYESREGSAWTWKPHAIAKE